MELQALVEGLSRRRAWPVPPERVEVVHTHASVVFLGDDEVFKIKKPVDFGFLDFSTLEKRRADCEAEVRLNRRLAPDVYLGLVPITEGPGGPGGPGGPEGPRFGGEGEAVEWAVHMRRLPDDRSFASLLRRGELEALLLRRFAILLADFFAAADSGRAVREQARFEVVERNALENLEGARVDVGLTLSRAVLDRLRELTRSELSARRALIESRAERGLARDGHGDLRLEHVYLLEDGELVVIDCISFNERFRFQDPVLDVSFLVMELSHEGRRHEGRRDLAESFVEAFLEATGDDDGRELLPLFVAYRHAVRAKVRGLAAREPEVPADERERALQRARAHWLAGLAELSPPGRRPCLVLVAGPPASGKSTLSRALAEAAGFERLSSDETRKALAGLRADEAAPAAFGEGLYTASWTERTYEECLREARRILLDGGRVLVDASFGEDAWRSRFLELARELGLRALWMDAELEAELARQRLLARGRDPSDADLEVQRRARESREPASAATAPARRALSTAGTPEESLELALSILREAALA